MVGQTMAFRPDAILMMKMQGPWK